MNLFTYYPKVNYPINNFDRIRAIDLNAAIKIRDYIKNFRGISYSPYVIQDGDRPDNVSFKIYDDPNYDWLIMLTNNMFSIHDDWPKSSQELERYIIEKYGSISIASSTIKYYYDADKNIIDLTTYNTLTSSNRSSESVLAWEQRINTQKRIIRVPTQSSIGRIQSELSVLNLKPVL